MFHRNSTRGFDSFYTEEFEDLFTSMVAFNPTERITVEQILDHEWLKNKKKGSVASMKLL